METLQSFALWRVWSFSLQNEPQPSRTSGWRDAQSWREGMIGQLLQTKASLLLYQWSHNNQRRWDSERHSLLSVTSVVHASVIEQIRESNRDKVEDLEASQETLRFLVLLFFHLESRRSSRQTCIPVWNQRAGKHQSGVGVISCDSRGSDGCASRTSGLQTSYNWQCSL